VIASLRGSVAVVSGGRAILDVGGVGYAVAVTAQHALSLRPGAEAHVYTALIVREDELSLYGFATPDELEVFDLLRGVTGVGPKSALGVLSALTPAQVAAAVAAEDDAAFRKVSGIGPKTAKLIVVSLAGKLPAFLTAGEPAHPAAAPSTRAEAIAALTSLGFPERRAEEAVDEAVAADPAAAVPALVRLALAALGPAGVR
jgi:Holliday junction DNA helicase RuvA